METIHHTSLQRIELVDLSATGKFDEILNTNSRLEAQTDAGYTEELDIAANSG